MASPSSSSKLIFVLLMLSMTVTVTAYATRCVSRRRRPCTTITRGGGLPCPKPQVCIVNRLGRPEVDLPHSGYCGSKCRGNYCEYNGYFFAPGLGGIPTGDGCNFCSCSHRAILTCSETPVVNCLVDPCQAATCRKYPTASCQANYCGGCNYDFYLDGTKVDCGNGDGGDDGCIAGGDDEQASCICPVITRPVCGSDGKTYCNACFARCAGVRYSPGKCPEPCICPAVYDPVCGSDGITYSNACFATCASVSYTPGECSKR